MFQILSSVVTKFQQPPPGEFAIPAPAGSGIQLSVDFRFCVTISM